jgi:hypothetical protein
LRGVSLEYWYNIHAEPTIKLSTIISLLLIEAIPEKGAKILSKLVEVYNLEEKVIEP